MVHQNNAYKLSKATNAKGEHTYTVVNIETGEVRSTRKSKNNYVAATLDGRFYFGKVENVLTRDHKKAVEFAKANPNEDNAENLTVAYLSEADITTAAPVTKEEVKVEVSREVVTIHTTETEVQSAPQATEPKAMKVSNEADNVAAEMMFSIPIAGMVKQSVKNYIDNESGLYNEVEARIKAEVAKLNPTHVHINNVKAGEVTGRTHKMFAKALQLITIESQIFIAGKAGTGKTSLAAQIAKAFSLPFAHISCTAGMSEAHLLGRMVADGSYISSAFVECYENGGVFLFDEVDAADANTMLVINSALANGCMSVPNRKDSPIAKRHENFYAVCAANTWGNGSAEYAGRGHLDAAFLDRFVGSKITVDYDTDLELELSGNNKEVCAKLWAVRKACDEKKIRRVVSTRAFVSAGRQVASGITLAEFMDTFTEGWSAEEKAKIA